MRDRDVMEPYAPIGPEAPAGSVNGNGKSAEDENPEHRRARARGCLGVLVVLMALMAAGVWYMKSQTVATSATAGHKGGAGESRAVPVTVVEAVNKSVPVEIRVVGNALPYQTVSVISQVAGQLIHVCFKQGDFVRKGQRLFQIDPRPLQAALDQATAQCQQAGAQTEQARAVVLKDRASVEQALLTVSKDESLVHQAQANLARDKSQQTYQNWEEKHYNALQGQGFVTAEQAMQMRAASQSANATVAADVATLASVRANLRADAATVDILRAAERADSATVRADEATERNLEAGIRNARVQLSYTDIYSPLDGRTGSLNFYEGNVIRANDTTPLVTIDQITPIYVTFAVPEQYLTEIRRYQGLRPLPVTAQLQEQTATNQEPDRGQVTFVDQAVDTTTGTITLRGTFPNLERHLWPGHYVNVRLMLKHEANKVVVPVQAVQPGQQGDYLFVLDRQTMTVDARKVVVERNLGNQAVLASGVKAGETVVTDGQMALVPGAKVKLGKVDETGLGSQMMPGSNDQTQQDTMPGGHHRRHPGGDPSGAPTSAAAAGGSPNAGEQTQTQAPATGAPAQASPPPGQPTSPQMQQGVPPVAAPSTAASEAVTRPGLPAGEATSIPSAPDGARRHASRRNP